MDASRDSATPAKSIRSPWPRELLPMLDVQVTTRQPGPKPLPVRPDAPRCLAECDGAGVAIAKLVQNTPDWRRGD